MNRANEVNIIIIRIITMDKYKNIQINLKKIEKSNNLRVVFFLSCFCVSHRFESINFATDKVSVRSVNLFIYFFLYI